jgi:CSLREA domain-containing protein
MNATRKYRRRRGWRPLLEVLEDRLVPANTYTVNALTDTGAGSGLAGDLRFCVTRADADPGSTIVFDATVFATPQTITLNGTALPDLTQATQVNGPAAGVTVNAAGHSRVFVIDAGAAVTISGLTVTGGFSKNDQSFNPPGNGGGIANSGSLTLTNCTLTGNSVAAIGANGGGAIANFASLTMSGCTVSANNASVSGQGEGGGITNDGTMSLTNCTVSGNSSGLGGGISTGGTATLTDCTVANNSNSGLINTGALTMTGCTVSGNSAGGGGTGGGMENFGNSTATLINCTVSGNTAGGTGGGFVNENGGKLILTNCTVTGNTANASGPASPGGGGIANFGQGSVALTNCTVSGNSSDGGGGILNQLGGLMTLTGCTLSGNTAGGGGGGLANEGTLALINCTLSGNSGSGNGGGLANAGSGALIGGGSATLTNCTVSGNTAGGSGGGIANALSQAFTLNNTIVAGNRAPASPDVFQGERDSGQQPVTAAFSLIGDGTGSGLVNGANGNQVGTSASPINPLLAPLGNYGGPTQTMALLPGSPALAAGSVALAVDQNGQPLTTDQRGQPRVVRGAVDVGAFEFQGDIVVNSTADNNVRDNVLTLREAILFADGTLKLSDLTAAEQQQVGSDPGEPNAFVITFDPTVFAAAQTITLGGTALPDVSKSVNVAIDGPAASLTINAAGKSRVLTVPNGATVTIAHLTLTGGSADSAGGAITSGGTLTLNDCTLSANFAAGSVLSGGGGISNDGVLALNNCTLRGNGAGAGSDGGGIANSGTATLTNCTLTGNSATNGGGVAGIQGTLTLTDCTLSGNTASAGGGGLFNFGAMATLTNCTLSGNTGSPGGGGLLNEFGTVTLTNCTLSGNSAGSGGGLSSGGKTTLTNTVVAGNTAASAPDVVFPNAAPVTASFNLIGDGTGSGLVNGINGNRVGTAANPLNPLLAPLGNYGGPTQTMALLPGSPAIDAGTSTGAPATDQRGLPRVGAVDIGAFESQGFTLTVLAGANQSTTTGTAFPTALAVKVTANNAVEPVQGGVVTFTAPASGASSTFANAQATATAAIDATGIATAPPLTANGTAGSYAVTASATGAASTAAFPLTNTPGTVPPIPPAPPGLSANERFVFHLYQVLLGRQPSTDEVSFFGSVLDQGFLTQEQLATFFLSSFEYHEQQVDQLYLRLLGRHVDAATEAVAALFLAAGGSLDQIEAVILGSDEYFQLHGGTNAGFLAGLGQDVLGGNLDPAAMNLLQAELAAGTPRYVVALQALGTPAAAVAEAQRLYQQVLGRSASSAELLVPAVYILAGNEMDVLLALLLSEEFAQLP